MTVAREVLAREVLRYWFGDLPGARRKAWFEKDSAFDADARARFLRAHSAAATGRLDGWQDDADSALALIVLTDQLPRNMFRGTPQAFATDTLALACARKVVAAGWDARLCPVERMFVYLPFEHSESIEDQVRSMELLAPLGAFEETGDTPDFARRHWEIVNRFARFPHRNAILGRTSTVEEAAFLEQPGSGF